MTRAHSKGALRRGQNGRLSIGAFPAAERMEVEKGQILPCCLQPEGKRSRSPICGAACRRYVGLQTDCRIVQLYMNSPSRTVVRRFATGRDR